MPSEVPTVSHGQSVEELRRELADAREQQAATAEILRMISSSPMDLRRIFAEMAVTGLEFAMLLMRRSFRWTQTIFASPHTMDRFPLSASSGKERYLSFVHLPLDAQYSTGKQFTWPTYRRR
jgi:hypothetical protein